MKIEVITCGLANTYLIRGEHASILVDTGTKKYRDKLLKQCRNANVRLILITHGHFDHCQNAAYLAKKLGCLIGIAKEDAALLEQGEVHKVFGKGIWGKLYAWAGNKNMIHNKIEPAKANVLLKDGMSLLPYGIDAKVVALPGHTKGSVGVLLSSGELLVGDAMQHFISASSTWCFEEFEQSLKSTKRIQKMNAKTVLYGHGKASCKVCIEE